MSKKRNLKSKLQGRIYRAYQYGKGVSRHELKKQGKADKAITSNNTYIQYSRNVTHFADWCKAKGIRSEYIAEKAAPEYLAELEQKGLANTTLKTYKAALSKCFGHEIDFKVGACNRADVTNNRGVKPSNLRANPENYKQATDLIKHCGVRRSEIVRTTEKASGHGIISVRGNKETGKIYLKIRGKGGKVRQAEWVGSREEAEEFYKDFRKTKENEQVYRLPKSVPSHRSRQVYAKALYASYARPLGTLSRQEKYYCRKELKGLAFDRDALYKVQHCLGHNDLHSITRYLFN